MEQKKHWYAFAFVNTEKHGSCYCGFPDKRVTIPRIKRAEAIAGIGEAVLLNFSYCGFMTREKLELNT